MATCMVFFSCRRVPLECREIYCTLDNKNVKFLICVRIFAKVCLCLVLFCRLRKNSLDFEYTSLKMQQLAILVGRFVRF